MGGDLVRRMVLSHRVAKRRRLGRGAGRILLPLVVNPRATRQGRGLTLLIQECRDFLDTRLGWQNFIDRFPNWPVCPDPEEGIDKERLFTGELFGLKKTGLLVKPLPYIEVISNFKPEKPAPFVSLSWGVHVVRTWYSARAWVRTES